MKPKRVRVSVGTAAVLGLEECRLDVKPTTAYLMTYSESGCIANCAFCPQARESTSKKTLLSRILWSVFPIENVLEGLQSISGKTLRRICIQVVNYPGFFEDTVSLLKEIKKATDLPVSMDTPPLSRPQMERLKEEGLERISIPIDAATPELFNEVKGRALGGPYKWNAHLEALGKAVEVFGAGRANTNLIIGLGETEKEAAALIQRLMDMDVTTGLFALTPIRGTILAERSPPPLESYRRLQMARHLITRGLSHYEDMEFDEAGRLSGFGVSRETLEGVVDIGEAFQTSGCPGCNRPYYNERPSGPFYNYPRKLTSKEARREAAKMGVYLDS
ncbi:MAG: radical SAM protein [Candidatus Bathyarchaeota archaeon]|nr:MAG: radical SAM protein [Candidatus Bathyarchaeota archaeon]